MGAHNIVLDGIEIGFIDAVASKRPKSGVHPIHGLSTARCGLYHGTSLLDARSRGSSQRDRLAMTGNTHHVFDGKRAPGQFNGLLCRAVQGEDSTFPVLRRA